MVVPQPAIVDIQDPLPENNWLWRRLFAWLFCIGSLALIFFIVDSLKIAALMQPLAAVQVYGTMFKWAIGMHALGMTLYMVAPSAEHIVRVFQSASIWKKGIAVNQVVTETPSGATKVETTTGPPVQTPPAEPAAPTKPQPPATGPQPTEILE